MPAVDLLVQRSETVLGRLVPVPTEGHGVPREQRLAAVALADQLAVSLPETSPT